jgi:hypothetical protein
MSMLSLNLTTKVILHQRRATMMRLIRHLMKKREEKDAREALAKSQALSLKSTGMSALDKQL